MLEKCNFQARQVGDLFEQFSKISLFQQNLQGSNLLALFMLIIFEAKKATLSCGLRRRRIDSTYSVYMSLLVSLKVPMLPTFSVFAFLKIPILFQKGLKSLFSVTYLSSAILRSFSANLRFFQNDVLQLDASKMCIFDQSSINLISTLSLLVLLNNVLKCVY